MAESDREAARQRLREIARASIARGDQTGWFESLYQQAGRDESLIPWSMRKDDWLADWLDANSVRGNGRRALVVGCGLGQHAAELQQRGFDVTAFDIAPTAVTWCRERYPGRPIRFEVADLLSVPAAWRRAFEFVFEANTLQTLRGEMRARAIRSLAELVAPGGELLVICRARDEHEPEGDLPWPLTRSDLSGLIAAGLTETSFEDFTDNDDPPVRRFRVLYRRA